MTMNAGIMLLKDKETPCIFYEQALPFPIKHVEFDHRDHCVTLVYDKPDDQKVSKFGNREPAGYKFDFPLDRIYVELIKRKKQVGASHIIDGQVIEFNVYSVIFKP